MPVRAVEGKLPYTGGEAISIDENKVISLNLRDENNLIIYDSGDDEIYVDLQLPAGIKPNYAFPVGVTTGRVLVADDWDVTGTILVAKTTSGDVIKLLYGDDQTLWIDNGTGLFKQIYFKSDVDQIITTLTTYINTELAKKQDKLIAGANINIASDGKTISAVIPPLSRFLSIWNCSTGLPASFPATTPFTYETGDYYLVGTVDNTTNYRPNGASYTGTASTTVETSNVAVGDVYIYDGSSWLLQINSGTGGGGDVQVSTDAGNLLTTGVKLWLGTETDFSSISTPDTNTLYIQYKSDGGGYTPTVNTIGYRPLTSSSTVNDQSGNNYTLTNSGVTFTTLGGVDCANFNGSSYLYNSSFDYIGTGDFTLSIRGYPTSNSQSMWLFVGGPYTDVVINSLNGYIQDTPAPTPINTWTYITFTRSSGNLHIYSNGVEYVDTPFTVDVLTNLYMGKRINNTLYLSGGLSECIVEDKAWTATEISDYFNKTKSQYGIS